MGEIRSPAPAPRRKSDLVESVISRLITSLQDRLDIPAETVTPDTTLDALNFDTVALGELAAVVWQDLGVSIERDELTLEHTVGEVAALLNRKGLSGHALRSPTPDAGGPSGVGHERR